jgi:hypothetical protein
MSPGRSTRSDDVVVLLDGKTMRAETTICWGPGRFDSVGGYVGNLEVDPASGLSDMGIDRKSAYDRPCRPFTICISNGATS